MKYVRILRSRANGTLKYLQIQMCEIVSLGISLAFCDIVKKTGSYKIEITEIQAVQNNEMQWLD